MPAPTNTQHPTLESLAQRHGFSVGAVRVIQTAVVEGAGSMASFEHPEFGGPGQWMRGGLLMLSDPFDHDLHARVDALCYDLGDMAMPPSPEPALANTTGIQPASASAANPGAWWPAELGSPTASGQQDGLRYAYFAAPRRLALNNNERVSVHDTGEHRIFGIAQQQTQSQTRLCFISQIGSVTIDDLPLVENADAGTALRPSTARAKAPSSSASPLVSPPHPAHSVLDAIERLGTLRQRGHLSDEEFESAKKRLLARL